MGKIFQYNSQSTANHARNSNKAAMISMIYKMADSRWVVMEIGRTVISPAAESSRRILFRQTVTNMRCVVPTICAADVHNVCFTILQNLQKRCFFTAISVLFR